MQATLKSIGHILTPHNTIAECPRNIEPNGPLCQLVVNSEFQDGLSGLVAGKKILILYWFENTDRNRNKQERNKQERKNGAMVGTFALRSPHRPNPIGAAVLPIEKIENGTVFVKGLDCLSGTHLLDIKPAILHEENT